MTCRAKSTVLATGGDGGTSGIARATQASKARSLTNELASKEPTGTKRKRAALIEVTKLVTNHKNPNVGGTDTAKAEGKISIVGAGAKITTAKLSGNRPARLPLSVIAGKRERTMRADNESATSTKTAEESTSTSVSNRSENADDKMEVDEPPAKLPRVEEETAAMDDEEIERVSKKHHRDQELVVEDSQVEADKIAAELRVAEMSPIQLWDDLDADDWDDPLMVSEYVMDVCDYLKEIEVCCLVRRLDYCSNNYSASWPPCPGSII